ncbi:MAG: ABC transporter permease subunit [Verrucomicrobiales bacterium]|jgi:ABC-type transport system involved in multi-copper enzyme maturation permease subunit|nr:ABC transporter permease subunit [Verrucomicrobiales bacterium]
MKNSLRHIFVIAGNTFTEAIRQKVLYVLVVFCLIMLGGSSFYTQFDFRGDDFKFMKDLAYAAISVIGLLVSLLGAAMLIPAELEKRTIYTLLSKPVRKFEFIVGKYLGLVLLLTLFVTLMAGIFMLAVWGHESSLTAGILKASQGHPTEFQQQMINEFRAGAYDPAMWQALVLIWAKLCLVTVISVLFSTVASSTVFIVSCTLFIYLIGHLQSVARDFWFSQSGGASWLTTAFLAAVSLFIPDFQTFNLIDEIISGNPVLWQNTWHILLYSAVYTVIALAVSALLFENREL